MHCSKECPLIYVTKIKTYHAIFFQYTSALVCVCNFRVSKHQRKVNVADKTKEKKLVWCSFVKGQVQHMKYLLPLLIHTVTHTHSNICGGSCGDGAHANNAGPKPAETQHRWLLFTQLALRHMKTEIISEVISA